MISGIYKIECLPTGKVYIGSAMNLRVRFGCHRHCLRKNKHHSSKLQRAWNKYGEDAFAFSIILICDKNNLLMYEQTHIDFFNSVETGFNVEKIAGNSLGRKHSKETRQKLSKIKKLQMTPERRKQIGDQHKCLKHSEATKQKMRLSAQKIPLQFRLKVQAKSAASRRKNGYAHSIETKEKIRLKAIGRKASEETKLKMSISRTGRKTKPCSAEKKIKIGLANRLRQHYPHSLQTRLNMKLAWIKRKQLLAMERQHA